MGKANQGSIANGIIPSKEATPNIPTDTHDSGQTNRVVLSSQSIHTYTTSISKGDAPVTTLLLQQNTESSVAARQAKVQREVNDAMAKLHQTTAQQRP
ncbi:hypothetical protein F4819DRAFT_456278 [Hypoxylon fuscum]|nr:hypothetical protein F4819DRAFT_456278 [Hypoxylon fuscum]